MIYRSTFLADILVHIERSKVNDAIPWKRIGHVKVVIGAATVWN